MSVEFECCIEVFPPQFWFSSDFVWKKHRKHNEINKPYFVTNIFACFTQSIKMALLLV